VVCSCPQYITGGVQINIDSVFADTVCCYRLNRDVDDWGNIVIKGDWTAATTPTTTTIGRAGIVG